MRNSASKDPHASQALMHANDAVKRCLPARAIALTMSSPVSKLWTCLSIQTLVHTIVISAGLARSQTHTCRAASPLYSKWLDGPVACLFASCVGLVGGGDAMQRLWMVALM